jgi:hypothetical protein
MKPLKFKKRGAFERFVRIEEQVFNGGILKMFLASPTEFGGKGDR